LSPTICKHQLLAADSLIPLALLPWNQQINLALKAFISLDSLGGGDFVFWCGKDVTVTTDDFNLEQKERSQQRQTEQRRRERSRRKRLILLAGIICALCLLFLMPSMISHSSIARSYLIDYLGAHGLQADVASVKVGWLTPLRVTDLKINGKAGSQIAIEQLDLNLTVSDVLSLPEDLGQIHLRGVAVACSMNEGQCSLESDFAAFLDSGSRGAATFADVQLHDVAIFMTKTATDQRWTLTQSNANILISPDLTELSVAGVLSEPDGNHGSLQSSLKLADEKRDEQWSMNLTCESLPISIAELLLTRFPDVSGSVPTKIRGDATGMISVAGKSNGSVAADLQNFDIRNLIASGEGTRVWTNARATLNGKLTMESDRLVGKSLSAHTDFATATIDGAFSRSFSLTGSNNNPLQWLEAIDGSASAEMDIAALERALPGLLPLRSDVTLESGRLIAHLSSIPNGSQQQKKLHIDCDEFRAVSRGREFAIDPITLTATVSSNDGQLIAEHFEWKSVFGTAIGSGDLESGKADFNIDFGQLTNMLMPIFEMTETRFAGNAHGKVQWKSGDQNVWQLTGNGQTTNLLIQLPGGRNIQRNAMRASIEAEGRWHNKALQELTQARVIINSLGLNINATLAEAVHDLSRASQLPFSMKAEGRLETMEGILDPWIPQQIDQLSGEFSADAKALVGLHQTTITTGAIELNEPSFNYEKRRFQQPLVKIQFDGNYNWPANAMQARSMTIAGNAFSLAGQGIVSTDEIDLELKYRAKLDRIQASLGEPIMATDVIRPVAYQTNEIPTSDGWMVLGDCEGSVTLRSVDNDLLIELNSVGQNIACVQPASQHASVQTAGPWRPQDAQQQPKATIVWSEPNLTLDIRLRHQRSSDTIVAEQVQIAGDWFAANMSGNARWTNTSSELQLTGASRLKMGEAARRFSKLADMDLRATGIHEAKVQLHVSTHDNGEVAFALVTDVGLESGHIAGMNIGQTTVPIILTETSLEFQKVQIPLNDGELAFAGQLHYRPGPLWMHIEPGATAHSIQLTPKMTNRWLKYVAPLVANTTRIQGTLGAQIDEAVIVFDHPEQTQVAGRINIDNAEMSAGPLASQIIQGIGNLASLATGIGPQPGPLKNTTNLVTMPPQTVDFSVRQGIVSHERLYLKLDRAQVITSGRVAFDGSLNMIAQVPLDTRWLGRDVQQLAGQVVTLPIDGSISSPSLDSSGLRQIATQLGTQAIQSTAENYLQQQLNKGLDKIFRW
jgi:translocation and assembly module TamB